MHTLGVDHDMGGQIHLENGYHDHETPMDTLFAKCASRNGNQDIICSASDIRILFAGILSVLHEFSAMVSIPERNSRLNFIPSVCCVFHNTTNEKSCRFSSHSILRLSPS